VADKGEEHRYIHNTGLVRVVAEFFRLPFAQELFAAHLEVAARRRRVVGPGDPSNTDKGLIDVKIA